MASFTAEKPRKGGLLSSLWSQIDILVLFISLTNGGVFPGPKIRHFRELTVLFFHEKTFNRKRSSSN